MIEISNLRKKLNNRWILNGVSLKIPTGKTTAIFGRSGEGKTVLLKHMIRLFKPNSGSIILDGNNIDSIPQEEIFKKVGYVFQFAALLDSLTVLENIGLRLLESGMSKEQIKPIVKEKLQLVNLPSDTIDKYPSELSGGMKKRVGLARTLVHNPTIILYDEPTTGLDPITSRIIHELMRTTQQKLNLTAIIVSHDVEAFNYADYVALLHEGTIKFFGPASTVWKSKNQYIYEFIRGGQLDHEPQQQTL